MSDTNSVWLFHGTRSSHADKIKAEGFGPGFLTQSLSQAWYYAHESVDESGDTNEEPVVLAIKVPTRFLKVDLPSIEAPMTEVYEKHGLRSEEEFHNSLEEHPIGWPEQDTDWEYSLFLVDCVRFSPDDDFRAKAIQESEISHTEIGVSDLLFDVLDPGIEPDADALCQAIFR